MRSRRLIAHSIGAGLPFIVGLGLWGCSGLEPATTFEQTTDPTQLYLELTVDHRAINLSTVAPYDTLQLTATPRNASGNPIEGLPAPTFYLVTPSDSTKLTVTPDGLLKGLKTANRIKVVADLTVPGNARHADTVQVNVKTGAPPRVASLSFDPVLPDSASMGMTEVLNNFDFGVFDFIDALFALNIYNPSFTYLPRVLDSLGNPVTGLLIEYTSLDPAISVLLSSTSLSTGKPKPLGVRPGQARIEARTTAYGVTVADTVLLAITWPVFQEITVAPGLNGASPKFQPADIRIAPYGIVVWQSRVGDTVDVTFDDPTNVASPPAAAGCDVLAGLPDVYGAGPGCAMGDILVPAAPLDSLGNPLQAATTRVRQFPVPGVYTYHSTRTGATGRVVVTADPDPAALP